MIILVLGANGETGMHVVEQAVAAGDRVIALVRGENVNVGLTRDGVDLIHGDATSALDLAKTMAGADVVISTIGGRGPSIMSDAVHAIIDGAHQTGMRRVVLMSSFAVERDRLGPLTKLMSNLTMGTAIADKTASERLLRSSDLEWTIVYATVLTNKPASGTSRIVPDDKKLSLTHTVSRADVASWLLKVAKDPSFVRHEVTISG
jgi:uncharacterized protein YbjT (DUF2867 family)